MLSFCSKTPISSIVQCTASHLMLTILSAYLFCLFVIIGNVYVFHDDSFVPNERASERGRTIEDFRGSIKP